MDNSKIKTFDIPPSPNIVSALSHSGYKIETSIADLLDNSITHNCRNIDINFYFKDENIDNWYVEIIDDGDGMDSEKLESAFVLGARSIHDERDANDAGRYSLGMKTASMAQANYLLVISKMNDKKITAKAMDMDYLDSLQQWKGYDYDDDPMFTNRIKDHGTIIEWRKIKFIDKKLPYQLAKTDLFNKIDAVRKHLSMVFHRFLEKGKITIKIQGKEIKPWDPFYEKSLKSHIVDTYEDEFIKTRTCILPSKDECTEDEFNEINRGDALSHQGFYVYRNDRMILAGGWLNLRNCKSHQKFNSLRISIDFDSRLDEYFDVGFTKSTIEFPKQITDTLQSIVKTGKQKVTENAIITVRKKINNNMKSKDDVWILNNSNNCTSCSINLNHPLIKEYTKGIDPKNLRKLFKLISGNIPTIYSNIPVNQSNLYTDEEIFEYMDNYYKSELMNRPNEYSINPKKFNDEVFQKMANIEPFYNYLDLLGLYFESEVNNNGH